MTITVSMPYFGCPELVGRAVESALRQTHRDIHLVIVGDGEEPPIRTRDSRVDVFTLPKNRGAYFAHQLVLLANPHDWWSPHDADDWSEPDHLERLNVARNGGTAVVSGSIWFHTRTGAVHPHVATYWIGVYGTARLRSFGGFNAAERVGQDSLTLHMLRLSGSVTRSNRPTYHRVKREGSLTTHPSTGLRSAYRKGVRSRNRNVARTCKSLPDLGAVRAYRERLMSRELRDELGEQVERLRERLGRPIAA